MTPLVPYRSVRTRVIVLALLVGFVLIGLPLWYQFAFFALSMALLLGTFPRAWVVDGKFQREFRLAFYPIHFRECHFDRMESIETGLESHLPLALGCLLGFQTVIFGKLLDWVLPWLGGDYKIWLRMGPDQCVLAWQGRGEQQFRQNLDLLEEASGRPVVRGSDHDSISPWQLLRLLEELPGGRFLLDHTPLRRWLGASRRSRDRERD